MVEIPSRSELRGGAMQAAGRKLELETVLIAAETPAGVGPALDRVRERVDVLIAIADPSIWAAGSVKAAAMFGLRNRLPLIGFSAAYTRAGAVASISAEDFADQGAQAADRAIALLEGGALDLMRVQSPRRTAISVNLVVARRIGIEPPRALIERAERSGGLFR
jgi:ABC-type uncharacterized transport system substrate-binding protein